LLKCVELGLPATGSLPEPVREPEASEDAVSREERSLLRATVDPEVVVESEWLSCSGEGPREPEEK